MDIKTSDDYLSNREWLSATMKGKDIILRGTSALEFLQLFGGYSSEKEIDIYSKEPVDYQYANYKIVNNFEGIETVRIWNTLCTTENQTINDMLADINNIDEQSLVEGLSRYYFSHDESFSGLSIRPQNLIAFHSLKSIAIEYYSNG